MSRNEKKNLNSIETKIQIILEYSNYGGGGLPTNFSGQTNFSVPPPSFGGNPQFKNDNQGNWQPPSAGGKTFVFLLTFGMNWWRTFKWNVVYERVRWKKNI